MGEVIRFPGSWVPDGLVEYMKRQGIPLTRENYIDLATDAETVEWGPEHEIDLPRQLRDDYR